MKTLKSRSLKQQLISVVVLLSTLPLLLLSVFSMRFIQNTDLQQTETRTQEIAENASQILEKSITQHKKSLNDFNHTIIEKDLLDFNKNQEVLKTLMHQYIMGDKGKINLYLVDDKGSHVGTANLPKYYEIPNFKNWGLLRVLNNTDETIFYPNYMQLEETFYTSYTLGKKVEINDTHRYYIILDFSTEYIQNLINSIKETSEGYVQFVITADTNRIIYNDSSFHSPIYYLDNTFRYERLDKELPESKSIELDEMIIESSTIEDLDITVFGLVPNVQNVSKNITLIVGIILIIVLTALISSLTGVVLTNNISQPIYELLDMMKLYRPFRPNRKREVKKYDNEIQELTHEFNKLLIRIEKYRKEDLKQQEMLRTSEIKSLMSQINPHFLNNTLDTIKWKAKLNDLDDIADMTTQLSVLLKASMNTEPFVSIKEEISFINNYALLQQNRYSDKFNFNLAYDESLLDYEIPKLILQPLVENAIVHGVEKSSQSVDVNVSVLQNNDDIVFKVKDNGPGFDQNIDFKKDSIGLTNIKNRLWLHYYENATLNIQSEVNKGTEATVSIKLSELKKVNQ